MADFLDSLPHHSLSLAFPNWRWDFFMPIEIATLITRLRRAQR